MLIGPPFKILDSQYNPQMDLQGKRVFVFNRRILSDETKEPQRIRLQPLEAPPTSTSTSTSISASTSVASVSAFDPGGGATRALLAAGMSAEQAQAVGAFEQYFQQQLKRGLLYEGYIQESLKTCRACLQQHSVQLDGIDAAISNLQYFHQAIGKNYEALEKKLSLQQQRHASVLASFAPSLQGLSMVQLHPAIATAIAQLSLSDATCVKKGLSASADVGAGVGVGQGTGLGGASVGSGMTLYDCVPVERERAYLQQCEANHRRVDESLRRAGLQYQEVRAGVAELLRPEVDLAGLTAQLEAVAEEGAAQGGVMRRLRNDYQFVYDLISLASASSAPSASASASASAAVAPTSGSASDSGAGDAEPGETIVAGTVTVGAGAELEETMGAESTCAFAPAPASASSTFAPTSSAETEGEAETEGHSGKFSTPSGAAGVDVGEGVGVGAVSPADSMAHVLGELQRRKDSQEGGHCIALMDTSVRRVREAKAELERSQNALLRSIYQLMRHIALLQVSTATTTITTNTISTTITITITTTTITINKNHYEYHQPPPLPPHCKNTTNPP
ncbi:hypothetical protein B484DRAFT_233054 [Ochromonadaceae sp. CCMP2298]|nr:hypothetical protein B484DRAFT_233054 [Ochromonadaceae sp. CCMP2298]